MGNAVVYFEIGGPDDRALAAFYGMLFGWRMTSVPGAGYTLIGTGGGISGGLGKSRSGDPWSAFYVEADDPQAVLDRAAWLGAKTVVPVTLIPGRVTYAMFGDPDGLLVGVMKAPAAGPAGPPPSAGAGARVDRFEVLGSDADATRRFYTEMFGWSVAEGPTGYRRVTTGAGHGISGGLGAAGGARWATACASVPDVPQALARAEELGGSRAHGPADVDDRTQAGAFRDPAGNIFGVHHHGTR